jgi:hypothetical protein
MRALASSILMRGPEAWLLAWLREMERTSSSTSP